jgi:hypothetical protein
MLFFSDVGLHILQEANDIFVGNVLFYLVVQWKIGIRDSIVKQDQILRNRIVTKIVIFIEWSTRFSGLGGGGVGAHYTHASHGVEGCKIFYAWRWGCVKIFAQKEYVLASLWSGDKSRIRIRI